MYTVGLDKLKSFLILYSQNVSTTRENNKVVSECAVLDIVSQVKTGAMNPFGLKMELTLRSWKPGSITLEEVGNLMSHS